MRGKMWQKVKVAPWVGDKYSNPDLFPYRTAILGESNYTTPEIFNPGLVVECVRCHLNENDDPNFSRFATKIRRLAFAEGSSVSPEAFWNNVAFYNLVQELVGEKARERPTEEMWRSSVVAFDEFVEKLRPQRLWVLGKANWQHLLRHVQHTQLDPYMVVLSNAVTPVVASYTNHPSSSLVYAEWAPVVKRLLFQEYNTAVESTA
jgi:hypothetical protein